VLALLLAASVVGVGLKIYWVWHSGPWDVPAPVKPRFAAHGGGVKADADAPPVIVDTDTIIAKNLFDPERGAGRTRETEAGTHSAQRIRSMILLGTAVLGSSRYAVVQDSETGPRQASNPAESGPRRLKLGDSIEGFRLTEIGEKSVVFANGVIRVELPIDYFRKVPVAAPPSRPPVRLPGVPGQTVPGFVPGQTAPGTGPRVIPNLPRRPRLPPQPQRGTTPRTNE
jgi:hypothetical protein